VTLDVSKKLRIAQIGVGYWGPNLLRNCVANKRCEVVKVAELLEERRDFVNRLYPSIVTVESAENIISDDCIDAVIVATPATTHFDLTMKLLESGKHVLVEKPMATTVTEIEEIEAMANDKQRVVMVGHTFVFNDAVRYLKKLVDDGELGDVRYIHCQRLNLGRIRTDIDALWNLAPHDVSIVQYLLGDPEPESVVIEGMSYVHENIDDVSFMHIQYSGKVMAHIHVSWLDPRKVRCMTVVGSKKMVVYDDISENKIAIYDKGIDRKDIKKKMEFDDRPFFYAHRSGDVVMPKIDFREPLETEIAHFIDCIGNGTPCLTGPGHAKKVVRILST